ncbi:hypothetical protein AKJ40_00760 [candidate division MSBL1 archaeon SCGC-AAA259M10]|uniref:Uncharacterized protein n=2 Tax=candidate division MSBL1 TaxID=215777 RepID=A0A133U879_9EURY|nr:hypothetical protein AKJ61_00845 [candidate division MSBL1 archaeon SCGC-AAA259B11]KXB00724.1 hypothetical protein AKJ40_00760 [candidate division MSBL1 archaeon SCGC-AAA259M10]
MIGEIVSNNPHQSFFDWVRGRFPCPNCGSTIEKFSTSELFPEEFSTRGKPASNLVLVPLIRVSVFLASCIFSDALYVDTMKGQPVNIHFRCSHCGYNEIIWKKYGRLVQGPIFYRGNNATSVNGATKVAAERFLQRKFRDWVSKNRQNGKKVLEAATSDLSLHLYYYPSADTIGERERIEERYRLLEISEDDFLRAFVGMKHKSDFLDLVEKEWLSVGDSKERERILSFNKEFKRKIAQSSAYRGNKSQDDRIASFLETIDLESVCVANVGQNGMAALANDLCQALFPPASLMLLSWELGENLMHRLKGQGSNLLVAEKLRLGGKEVGIGDIAC